MVTLESESQWLVPPNIQNESSIRTVTSDNFQLLQQGSEDRSPKEFERHDAGDEHMNEFDLAEEEESNSQSHIYREGNDGKYFCK
jgi:hypothetical protein